MKPIRAVVVSLILTTLSVTALVGQGPGGGLADQNLRAYWHVFAAYAIAWLLIGGWVISIARRLGRLEGRTGD